MKRRGRNQALDLASALLVDTQGLVGKLLDLLESLPTTVTLVFVKRHIFVVGIVPAAPFGSASGRRTLYHQYTSTGKELLSGAATPNYLAGLSVLTGR